MKRKIFIIIAALYTTTKAWATEPEITQAQLSRVLNLSSDIIREYYKNIERAVIDESIDAPKKQDMLAETGHIYFINNNLNFIPYTNDFGSLILHGNRINNYEDYQQKLSSSAKLSSTSLKIEPQVLERSNVGYNTAEDYYYFLTNVKVTVSTSNTDKDQYDVASESYVYFLVMFNPGTGKNAGIKFSGTHSEKDDSMKKAFRAITQVSIISEKEYTRRINKKTKNYLQFNITPADAAVTIDGNPVLYGDNEAVLTTPGKHNISISRKGYKPVEKKIDCSTPGVVPVTLSLQKAYGTLSITDKNQLDGFSVFVDDSIVGILPLSGIKLQTGIHKVTFWKTGYLKRSRSINISENSVTEVITKMPVSKEQAIEAGILTAYGAIIISEIVKDPQKAINFFNKQNIQKLQQFWQKLPKLPHNKNNKK